MPGIGVIVAAGPPASSAHPHVTLTSQYGTCTFDVLPGPEDYDDLAGDWDQIDLPATGRKALVPGLEKLATLELKGIIGGHPGGDGLGQPVRITDRLIRLRNMARHTEERPVSCSVGQALADAWIITRLRWRSVRRREGDNAIVRAEIDLTLTEAVFVPTPNAGTQPGQVSWGDAAKVPMGGAAIGGTVPVPVPGSLGGADRVPRQNGIPTKSLSASAAGASTSPASRTARRHVVTAGENPWTIADRYYGDGGLAPLILEANGIRDHRRVVPGVELLIP